MELVSFAKEVIQNVAEHAASYRLGQTALRHCDRALWVVEKCARWAIPPPLDQDDRPQPELVRPLPWVFFLAMLVTLRITRESISLVNLILGKPPLRSADVVTYIQSKRRYLRTLKYQGNRMIRARSAPSEPWYSGVQALFEFTMCFRRSHNYGNNNTTRVSNNDEILVVKRSKRTRDPTSPVASSSEATMERLIEKMMVDLDADSDDDSSFTLTNATSIKSDRSDHSESEQDTLENHNDTAESFKSLNSSTDALNAENNVSPKKEIASSTPDKKETKNPENSASPQDKQLQDEETKRETKIENVAEKEREKQPNKATLSEANNVNNISRNENDISSPEAKSPKKEYSPKEDTKNFIQSERCSPVKPKQAKFGRKIALAFTKTFSSNKHLELDEIEVMGLTNNQRRDTEIPVVRVVPADDVM